MSCLLNIRFTVFSSVCGWTVMWSVSKKLALYWWWTCHGNCTENQCYDHCNKQRVRICIYEMHFNQAWAISAYLAVFAEWEWHIHLLDNKELFFFNYHVTCNSIRLCNYFRVLVKYATSLLRAFHWILILCFFFAPPLSFHSFFPTCLSSTGSYRISASMIRVVLWLPTIMKVGLS